MTMLMICLTVYALMMLAALADAAYSAATVNAVGSTLSCGGPPPLFPPEDRPRH